jgi:S-formylglutathione hydrolase FrmB
MRVDRRAFLSMAAAAAAIPGSASGGATSGRIETLGKIGRGDGPEPRIRVWLPPSYHETGRPHQTLYMLDGQYAFATDSGGTNFAADRRVAHLTQTGTIAPTLIVAIDNLEEDRFLQYMPQTIYDRAGRGVRSTVEREIARVGKKSLSSAQFIRFLENELKPHVDARYRTSRTPLDTAIFGASMAGVMAGAIFVEAPKSFGRGACMSPNWAIYDKHMIDHPGLPALWSSYFGQVGGPAGRRLWLDHGTEMMDAGMAPHQSAIAKSLVDLGWRRGCNLQTRVYEAGHAFAETAAQMDEVLAWILA